MSNVTGGKKKNKTIRRDPLRDAAILTDDLRQASENEEENKAATATKPINPTPKQETSKKKKKKKKKKRKKRRNPFEFQGQTQFRNFNQPN